MKAKRRKLDYLIICHMPNASKASKERARKIVKRKGGVNIRFSQQYKIELDEFVYAMVGQVYA